MRDGALRTARLPLRWGMAAGGLLVAVVLLGIVVGPAGISIGDVFRSLVARLDGGEGLDPRMEAILWEIRIPRVVLGGLVGAALAGSGATYQGVFRNPLADPYLLGVAAGAGLGATLAITSGWTATWGPVGPLPLAAFVGGLLGVGLTYLVGSAAGRTNLALILAGIAVAAFLTAVQTYVQQRHADTLREVYGWILGRLSTVGWTEVVVITPYLVVAAAITVAARGLLDVLAVGDEEATALGISPARVRNVLVVAATLGAASAVAVSGLIGFVGIIVPHTIRLVVGASYRAILPLSFVLGAAFLILADVLARTVVAPAELPIGVVTAFFGAPFFALVLRTTRGGMGDAARGR